VIFPGFTGFDRVFQKYQSLWKKLLAGWVYKNNAKSLTNAKLWQLQG